VRQRAVGGDQPGGHPDIVDPDQPDLGRGDATGELRGHHTVYRSTTANFTPSAATQVVSGISATSNVSTGLAVATTYFFAVVAVDAAGTSPVSRVTATTQGTGTGTCHVGFTVVNSWSTGFQVGLSIQNTGTAPINGWSLTWTFPGSQQIASLWNGTATQSSAAVTVTSMNYNGTIAAGSSYNDVGFTANGPSGIPTAFAINGIPCN
jgi:mannan endo-1,4-beta-mannosidase